MIRANLTGRVGKDAEVKSNNGSKYVAMDVATDIFVKGENKTDWVCVYCNNPKVVKLVEEKGLFKKGALVEVRGSMTFPKAWVSKKTGELCASNVLLADFVEFAKGRKRSDGDSAKTTPPTAQQEEQMPLGAPARDDEDPPF